MSSPAESAVPLQAITGVPDGYRIAEDLFEACECGRVIHGGSDQPSAHAAYEPSPNCFWCRGTGYRLTKRSVRPIDMGEQAAHAQIKTLQATVLKAAATVEQAADLLDRAGRTNEAHQTRAAAKAIREQGQ